MSPLCSRCGTSLPPTAAICGTCCQPVEGALAELPRFEPAPVVPEAPAEPEPAEDEPVTPVGQVTVPNQRKAFFNPVQAAKTPPPNTYLAAERRQYALLRESAAAAKGLSDSNDG